MLQNGLGRANQSGNTDNDAKKALYEWLRDILFYPHRKYWVAVRRKTKTGVSRQLVKTTQCRIIDSKNHIDGYCKERADILKNLTFENVERQQERYVAAMALLGFS